MHSDKAESDNITQKKSGCNSRIAVDIDLIWEEMNMSKFLEAFVQKGKEYGANMLNAAEVHGDNPPEEIAAAPCNPCQDVYSVAKAFTMTAVGMLCDRGLLSTEDKVTTVLGDLCPVGMDERWHKVTVHHALKHMIGLRGRFLDIACIDANTFGKDYLTYMLTAPFEQEPCVERRYTDGAFYLLSRVVEARAGVPLDNFLWEHLFFPLGCREMAWSRCPMGHAMGATGLYIRAQEMAKLGAIYLHDGVYGGKRYLSKEWVEKARTEPYEIGRTGIRNSYGKGGMRSQMMLICPDTDRVVAWQCFGGTGEDFGSKLERFAAEYED